MNLPAFHHSPFTIHHSRSTLPASRARESGMAVIGVLGLLAIVLIYMAANIRTLNTLDGELKLIERQQTHRLTASSRAAKIGGLPNALPQTPPTHE
jgi:hypothetical protein